MKRSMEPTHLSKDQQAVVERVAHYFQQSGSTQAAAYIQALLIAGNKTALTFDEIRETLHLSKGSTSNAIKLLLSTNQLIAVTYMGDRKRYFKSTGIDWETNTRKSLNQILQVNTLLTALLQVRKDDDPTHHENLKKTIAFFDHLHGEINDLFAKRREQHP
ncbi:GbsR/MarR family transcriptional regulator [Chitinophaga nivalis]|uniref:HTH marR-type domain-containing protein n=1 Tax=Chitinophaga nivalis TaxID=2991709 RepID=A0ABT3IMR0_9BACT|nr:hypothetical protein [Chitinophaga nivalis]MCW3465065.1 hypothetical protein [Chitinophaga nivalis]MCW3485243.1 hypothetical protein [Chitinophaga nivalis]